MNDESLICPNCGTEVSQIEIFCDHCKYPLAGTDKEKAIFIGKQISNKSKIGDAKDSQHRVSIILYIVALFMFLNAFLVYKNLHSLVDAIIYSVLGIILIVIGILAPKKPILFISMALFIMISYYALLFIIDPQYLFQGIVWKIVIISSMIYGLIHAIEARRLKKNHKFLKES